MELVLALCVLETQTDVDVSAAPAVPRMIGRASWPVGARHVEERLAEEAAAAPTSDVAGRVPVRRSPAFFHCFVTHSRELTSDLLDEDGEVALRCLLRRRRYIA